MGMLEFLMSAPLPPVPGLRDERNVYHPVQRGDRRMTYMERMKERKAIEDVRFC